MLGDTSVQIQLQENRGLGSVGLHNSEAPSELDSWGREALNANEKLWRWLVIEYRCL
jgi:hypothetical protein